MRVLRRSVPFLIAAALVAAASSCARGNAAPLLGSGDYRPMGADFRETGTYRFRVQTTDGVQAEGWVNVTADTIIVRGTPGPCYYDREARSGRGITYRCSDRFISFDRRRPVTGAVLLYPKRVQATRRVCGEYTITRTGMRSCSRYEMETSWDLVLASARIVPLKE